MSTGRTIWTPATTRPWSVSAGAVPKPPSKLRFMDESRRDFKAGGDALIEAIQRHTDIAADARILDIGCGYGRLAHALRRGGFPGSYTGIDVLPEHIEWCARELGSDRYEFRHVDLPNERYNPDGKATIADIDFGGEKFDVICAFSVFTHMWPEDVAAYLRLIRKSLTPEGTAVTTFFLIDDVWRQLEADGSVALTLPHRRGEWVRYESEKEPLHRVAYESAWVLNSVIDLDMYVPHPVVWGFWSWRPIRERHGYQDEVAIKVADFAAQSDSSGGLVDEERSVSS